MYSLYGAQDVLIEILSSNSKEELRILSDLYSWLNLFRYLKQ